MSKIDRAKLDGHFDGYVRRQLHGWAADKADVNAAVAVDFIVDDFLVCTVKADLFREGLSGAGWGNGKHAFQIDVPTAFLDSVPRHLKLQIHGTDFAIKNTPDVIVFGHQSDVFQERQPVIAVRDAAALPPAMSIIMPTFGRGPIMERTIRALTQCLRWDEVELIVVDDGSRDDTQTRLRNLRTEFPNIAVVWIENSGPARARNLAASTARSNLLLFVGDDVEPVDRHFLATHIESHAALPDRYVAILGKIVWHCDPAKKFNFVMQHIQGDGQQQFGYKFMEPYKTYDWGLFYSSNVSLKRDVVADWLSHGYDEEFDLAAFEDAEFAFRLSCDAAARGKAFQVVYVPAATLAHDHYYSVASFIQRQISCGLMARRFFQKHPSLAAEIGIKELNDRLRDAVPQETLPLEHYFSVFEGLKSWAILIDHSQVLGTKNWHGDFLKAVFQVAFSEGYLRAAATCDGNVASAAKAVLNRLEADLGQCMFREALGGMREKLLA